MLTIPELTRWTGITVFELLLHSTALLFTSGLLFLKLNHTLSLDYWQIFTPLFVASALNCYFLFIVFIRTALEERQLKRALLANVFNFLRSVLIFLFEAMLCYKVKSDVEHEPAAVESTYAAVFTPIWLLMIVWVLRACKLLQ